MPCATVGKILTSILSMNTKTNTSVMCLCDPVHPQGVKRAQRRLGPHHLFHPPRPRIAAWQSPPSSSR